MDPFLFKALHVTAAFAIFAGIGTLLASDSPEARKKGSMLHGIGLVFALLLGFAMLKKPPMDQHWWMAKTGIWLFLGAVPALIKRKALPSGVILALTLFAGGAAAYFAMAKPF